MVHNTTLGLVVGFVSLTLADAAQAQNRPAYRPNQGSYNRGANIGTYSGGPRIGDPFGPPRQTRSQSNTTYFGNYGRSPSGRYYAPPRPTPVPQLRLPSAYKPGGSLYSPFNMGQTGMTNASHN